tara:strand:+ start:89 stop:268 length:180 start_codon:yes stop_codon:yes gene_type:complete
MKNVRYSEKYGWVFPGKYWLLGAIGVAGLFLSGDNHPVLTGVFIFWIFGCILGLIFGDR